MNINKEKHFKTEKDALSSALEKIENRYAQSDKFLKEILDIASDWYETDNLLCYTFFDKAFPTTFGPRHFYDGLYSFLINCLVDDSYYELRWYTFDEDMTRVDGEAWKDEPYVVWSYDDKGIQDCHTMLKAMKFAIQRENERAALFDQMRELQAHLDAEEVNK